LKVRYFQFVCVVEAITSQLLYNLKFQSSVDSSTDPSSFNVIEENLIVSFSVESFFTLNLRTSIPLFPTFTSATLPSLARVIVVADTDQISI
jgi:hypothetical protein